MPPFSGGMAITCGSPSGNAPCLGRGAGALAAGPATFAPPRHRFQGRPPAAGAAPHRRTSIWRSNPRLCVFSITAYSNGKCALCRSRCWRCLMASSVLAAFPIPLVTFATARLCASQGEDALPRVTVTSYEMLRRLTCEPCRTGAQAQCTGARVCCVSVSPVGSQPPACSTVAIPALLHHQ